MLLICGFQSAFFATICPNLRSKPRRSEPLQLNRQPFTALEATGLEHPSPAFSTHAGPKAVHPAAAPLLGLISSFRHDALSSLRMNVTDYYTLFYH